MTDPADDPVTERPTLRVVKGDPSDEELAALVTVVSALGAARDTDERPPRSEWSSPRRAVRAPLAATWRSSTLPR